MKLGQIRNLVTIAQCGSLRSAARHLGLAQPALTRSIRELEQELGVSLFERAARGMKLTKMGETFLRRARLIHAEVVRSREEIDQLKGSARGTVAIGLSMAAHIALLPRALTAFQKRFPETEVRVEEGLFTSLGRSVEEGDLDFYVGPTAGATLPQSLAREVLFKNERVVLGRKGHPLAGATSLAQLADASWVGASGNHSPGAGFHHAFEAHGAAPPRVAVHAPSALSVIVIAANTDMLAVLTKQWLEHPWTENLLHHIAIRQRLDAPDICLVHRTGVPLTPAAEYFADLMRRVALSQESSVA
jgi:LysR family transcriptional regulator, regulator of abg operon